MSSAHGSAAARGPDFAALQDMQPVSLVEATHLSRIPQAKGTRWKTVPLFEPPRPSFGAGPCIISRATRLTRSANKLTISGDFESFLSDVKRSVRSVRHFLLRFTPEAMHQMTKEERMGPGGLDPVEALIDSDASYRAAAGRQRPEPSSARPSECRRVRPTGAPGGLHAH